MGVSPVRAYVALRCGSETVRLDDAQFTCVSWMQRRFGRQGSAAARLLEGGRFLEGALGDIAGFVNDVRMKLGEPLTVGVRGEALLSREVYDEKALALVDRLGLAYSDQTRGGALHVGGRRASAARAVSAARLGDVAPLVEVLGILDRTCRLAARENEALEVEVRYLDENAVAELEQGRVAVAEGRIAEGIALLKKALKRDPRFADARLELGRALVRSGKRSAGLEQLERVISQLPPGDPVRRMAEDEAQIQRRSA